MKWTSWIIILGASIMLLVSMGYTHYWMSVRGLREFDNEIHVGSSKSDVTKMMHALYPGLRKVKYQGDPILHIDIGTRFYLANESSIAVRIVDGIVISKRYD